PGIRSRCRLLLGLGSRRWRVCGEAGCLLSFTLHLPLPSLPAHGEGFTVRDSCAPSCPSDGQDHWSAEQLSPSHGSSATTALAFSPFPPFPFFLPFSLLDPPTVVPIPHFLLSWPISLTIMLYISRIIPPKTVKNLVIS
uniref:Uncharacterized protein n=1 Tax=Anopheles arabiensis TaxID=7173 RepID=A0A182IH82_ANOAR